MGWLLVSFRINMASSLLEVRVEGRPGWFLACHERWSLSLGTLLCQQLGYLRWARRRQPLQPLLTLFRKGCSWEKQVQTPPAKEVRSWLLERQDCGPLLPGQGYVPDPLAGPWTLPGTLHVASAE